MNKQYFKPLLACVGLIAALFSSSVVMADSIIVANPTTGHKYQRVDQSLNWFGARDYCKKTTPSGGYLVTITSQEEENFVINTFITGQYTLWLGSSNVSGNWQWATTTEKFGYTDWANGEPLIANEQYLILNGISGGSYDKKWHVADGNSTLPYNAPAFICEWGGMAYKDYVGSAALDDMNANNLPEIATLYTADATGKVTVQVKDASTKAIISTVVFGKPNTSFPMSVAVLPDMNANGFQEIAVLLIDNVTLKATQEIRDASTGVLISSVPF